MKLNSRITVNKLLPCICTHYKLTRKKLVATVIFVSADIPCDNLHRSEFTLIAMKNNTAYYCFQWLWSTGKDAHSQVNSSTHQRH